MFISSISSRSGGVEGSVVFVGGDGGGSGGE
jgi:hypothetical protein